ncbi:MAG: glutamate--tRNA ligase [Rhizobiaceae bacterium]
MTVTVRFAPSPTGRIHIGNARTALFNWLYRVRHGGRFILRFDDTDAQRSRREHADAIEVDLAWLGVVADEVHRQSERVAHYDAATALLKASGLLYPCYETAEELDLRRKIQLSRGLPPVYGRDALKLSAEERARLEREGRSPHWRFLLPNFTGDPHRPERTLLSWNDLIRGEETVDLASLSDPVLVREDGAYLYTLPSVVDDIAFGVSDVIRGGDHVTNTGVQIALFRALGAVEPRFGHHNLITTTTGEGLSKRSGALSIGQLRADGYEPMAVNSLAVLIGTSEAVRAEPSLAVLAGHFDPSEAGKAPSRFDPAELGILNAHLVHGLAYDNVAARLTAFGVAPERAEAFWLAVRGNCGRVQDAADWWRIISAGPEMPPSFDAQDTAFLDAAFELLPPEPWGASTYGDWIAAVKDKTGRKGKALFEPIRLALTGRSSGPEIAGLLPLLGRAGTLARRP